MIVTLEEPDEIASAEMAVRERLLQAGLPPGWARVGSVFEDQYLKIDRYPVRFSSGALGTYLRVEPGRHYAGGVAIVTLHEDSLVLVKQFRFATQREHMEVPRGFLGRHEDIVAAAMRELAEETGSVASRTEYLGPIWPDNGILSWCVHVVLARIDELGMMTSDEITSVSAIPIAGIDEAMSSGLINDGISLSAVALARARRAL